MKMSLIFEEMDKSKMINFNNMLEKLDMGKIFIEFMRDKTNKLQFVARFEGSGVNYFFNKKRKSTIYFSSIQNLKTYIQDSLDNIYESDLKAVHRIIFDPKDMDKVEKSLEKLATQYQDKAQSLTFDKSHAQRREKNSGWDAEIIFRQSAEEFGKNNSTKIIPKVTGADDYANAINKNEVEKPMKKRKLKNFLNSLQSTS